MAFLVEIISPEKKVFSGRATKLTVPSVTGQLTVLSHHIPLFTPLNTGQVKMITTNDQSRTFKIGKGMMAVRKDKVSLLIEPPEYTEEKAGKEAELGKKQVVKIKKERISESKKALFTPLKAVRRSLVDLNKVRKRRRPQPAEEIKI